MVKSPSLVIKPTARMDLTSSEDKEKSTLRKNLICASSCTTIKFKSAPAPLRTLITISLSSLIIIAACEPLLVQCSRTYNSNNYDPELQDGIPIFSARSVPRPPTSSTLDNDNDDDWSTSSGEQMSAAPNQPVPAQRRQSDGDLDDGIEDEEEDEYKSGSSPRESIEAPGYGESRRFAQDGDEIEDFFDKHLGPPKESVAAEESSPSGSVSQGAYSTVPASDPDDQYEAAASGPLATIFQTLLGHHADSTKSTKRPFLQIATSAAGSSENGDSSSSSSSPSEVAKGLKTSQSAQSYVNALPIALTFTPVAASSSLTVQEPAGGEQPQASSTTSGYEQDGSNEQASVPEAPGSGIREIYIGRRPTVMSYLQQAAQQQQQQQQQATPPLAYYTQSGSANVWRGLNGRPMMYEQEQSADYSRYPVAASYAHQREQQTGASSAAASPVGDDEQTVTYGLSFGGGSTSDSKDELPSPASAEQESEQHGSEDGATSNGSPESPDSAQQQAYVPYNTKYSASSTSAHNNYNYNNQYGAPAGYVRAYPSLQQQHSGYQQQSTRQRRPQQMTMMMMRQQQQQQHLNYPHHRQQQYAAGATRYHRDPSESTNHLAAMRAAHMGINYAGAANQQQQQQQQHRGLSDQSVPASAYGQQRQRLLASLDREIKASRQYQQQNGNSANAEAATANANLYARRPAYGAYPMTRQHLIAFRTATDRGQHPDHNDLDTYNSYHSEVDPYKTFTKTSHMIKNAGDPFAFLANTRPVIVHSAGSMGSYQRQTDNDRASSTQPSAETSNVSDASVNQKPESTLRYGTSSASASSQQPANNLPTGPLMNYDSNQASNPGQGGDLLRTSKASTTSNGIDASANNNNQGLTRVRRDDSDEREIDDDSDDSDGVWVDDDGDDDNKQQSSDLHETSQEPESEEDESGQQDADSNVSSALRMNPPGVIGGPHGYELSPNDLMIYHG